MMNYKKILISSRNFHPDYLVGGGVVSATNLAISMTRRYEVHVITRSSDNSIPRGLNDDYLDENQLDAFGSIRIHQWSWLTFPLIVFKIFVFKNNFSIVIFNSFYCVTGTIVPLVILKFLCCLKLQIPVILLAPRGELMDAAFRIRKTRKIIYNNFFKIFRLDRKLFWLASSNLEKESITDRFAKNQLERIFVAPDFFPTVAYKNVARDWNGRIRLCYISRITKKKNLLMAVIALKRIAQEVPRMHLEFNIFGPIVEKDYFKDIMAKIRHDPRENLKISYLGTLKRSNVYSALGSHHFMLLPTAGENFGYIVIEGAAVGCVPIISRFTAWADIQERGAGFVVDISSQESLESDLKNILSQFSPTAYEKLSKNALSYYRKKIIEDDAWSQHEKIFERVSHEV